MTLASILRQKLNDAPPADERHEFHVADPASGWALYLTAERRDAWSTVAWEMSLRRSGGDGDVALWAQRIVERTSGLLESLGVVEIDAPHTRALLRSAPPTDQGGKIGYFEVVLQGAGSALVRRYHGAHYSGKRQQIAYVLTNEVLSKWVEDLTND